MFTILLMGPHFGVFYNVNKQMYRSRMSGSFTCLNFFRSFRTLFDQYETLLEYINSSSTMMASERSHIRPYSNRIIIFISFRSSRIQVFNFIFTVRFSADPRTGRVKRKCPDTLDSRTGSSIRYTIMTINNCGLYGVRKMRILVRTRYTCIG